MHSPVTYTLDRQGGGPPSVVETNSTSLELSLPINQDYVIQIKPFSEGGEGSSSRITIPRIAGPVVMGNGLSALRLALVTVRRPSSSSSSSSSGTALMANRLHTQRDTLSLVRERDFRVLWGLNVSPRRGDAGSGCR
ncbi:hypothetical protein CRUP_024985 [Coryphaenoides rupestris]|nr:hypothetical protein CRUP_024985 [Coryphaenoides rupestris]